MVLTVRLDLARNCGLEVLIALVIRNRGDGAPIMEGGPGWHGRSGRFVWLGREDRWRRHGLRGCGERCDGCGWARRLNRRNRRRSRPRGDHRQPGVREHPCPWRRGDVADEHHAVHHLNQRRQGARLRRRDDEQQSVGGAKAVEQLDPAVAAQQRLVIDGNCAAREDDEIASGIHRVRDLVQRDAVEEAVDEAVRRIHRHEIFERRELAHGVGNRHAPTARLHARDAERDLGRGRRTLADYDRAGARVERGCVPIAFRLPHGEDRSEWRGH